MEYSNDTLTVMFKQIHDKLEEHTEVHRDILDTIKEGITMITTKQDMTNGRVKKNEIRIATAIGGLSVVVVVLLPLLSWALITLVNIRQDVHNEIKTALSAYNIQVEP